MSLVNDMLNDLERRRDKTPAGAMDLGWLTGSKTAKPRRGVKLLLLLSVVAAVALLAVVAWRYQPSAALEQATQLLNEKPSQAATQRAQILRVSWKSDDGAIYLRWRVDKQMPYSLARDDNGLTLRFFDTESRLGAGDLKPVAPVQSMLLRREEQDTVVSLAISGDFSFSDRVLKEQDSIEILIQPVQAVEKKSIAPPPQQSDVSQNPVAEKILPATDTVKTIKPTPTPVKVVQETPAPAPQLTLSQQDLRQEQRARTLLQSGDSFTAQQQLSDFVSENPQAIRSGKLLATIWLSQQQYDRADTLLQSIVALAPSDIEARELTARLRMARGNHAAAVDGLMQAAPTVSQHASYYELLGLAARQSKQYALSEQVYKGLLDTDASRGDWWVGIAIALDAQGKVAAARGAYQQALATTNISLPLQQYAQQRLATLN